MHLACLAHDFGLGAQQTDQVEWYRIFYTTSCGAANEIQILFVSGHTRLWPHEVWFAPLYVRNNFPTSWGQFWVFFLGGFTSKWKKKPLEICFFVEALMLHQVYNVNMFQPTLYLENVVLGMFE